MTPQAHVAVTERAAAKVREFFARDGHEESLLRVSLVRTHCMGGRGFMYQLAPQASPNEGDVVREVQGVRIAVGRDDVPRLEGTVIDYQESLEGSGFSVRNPHATAKCPCGHHDLLA